MSGINNFQKPTENFNLNKTDIKNPPSNTESKNPIVTSLLEDFSNHNTYDSKLYFNTNHSKTTFDPAGPSLFNEKDTLPPLPSVNQAPSIENIKTGKAILEENQSGESIKQLKNNLTKLGFNVSKNDAFDEETKKAVQIIQSSRSLVNKTSPNYGKVGKSTFAEIESLAKTFTGNAIPESIEGRKLRDAGARIAGNKRSGGKCYTGVWNAIEETKLDKKGITPPQTVPARDFGEWGIHAGKKAMGRVMPFLDPKGNLIGLKPGDIIVYEKGVQGHHPLYGHIEIYGGGKNFYSDFNSGQTGYDQLVTGIKNGQIKNGQITILRLKNSTPVNK